MMALSLTALFGLVGFTVDVGASYYTKQKAQAAAESAAMAAAAYAKANGVTCGTNGITCNSTLTSCSSITTGVLYVGCQYANQNGFPMSAISMAANTTTPPCNPCTAPSYWIQAKVATTHNNLFLEVAQVGDGQYQCPGVCGSDRIDGIDRDGLRYQCADGLPLGSGPERQADFFRLGAPAFRSPAAVRRLIQQRRSALSMAGSQPTRRRTPMALPR